MCSTLCVGVLGNVTQADFAYSTLPSQGVNNLVLNLIIGFSMSGDSKSSVGLNLGFVQYIENRY